MNKEFLKSIIDAIEKGEFESGAFQYNRKTGELKRLDSKECDCQVCKIGKVIKSECAKIAETYEKARLGGAEAVNELLSARPKGDSTKDMLQEIIKQGEEFIARELPKELAEIMGLCVKIYAARLEAEKRLKGL
jgi:hypothetical protein